MFLTRNKPPWDRLCLVLEKLPGGIIECNQIRIGRMECSIVIELAVEVETPQLLIPGTDAAHVTIRVDLQRSPDKKPASIANENVGRSLGVVHVTHEPRGWKITNRSVPWPFRTRITQLPLRKARIAQALVVADRERVLTTADPVASVEHGRPVRLFRLPGAIPRLAPGRLATVLIQVARSGVAQSADGRRRRVTPCITEEERLCVRVVVTPDEDGEKPLLGTATLLTIGVDTTGRVCVADID
jgi:hypothetical protein